MSLKAADLLRMPTRGWMPGCEILEAKYQGKPFAKPPTMVVLHRGNGPGDIAHYFHRGDPQHIASAHFVVDKSGLRWQCVSLNNRAQHAGPLYNYRSIGIEQQGPINSEFTDHQIESLLVILRQVKGIYPSLTSIVAHSRINPLNRKDPGKNFPWCRLEGLGYRLVP